MYLKNKRFKRVFIRVKDIESIEYWCREARLTMDARK